MQTGGAQAEYHPIPRHPAAPQAQQAVLRRDCHLLQGGHSRCVSCLLSPPGHSSVLFIHHTCLQARAASSAAFRRAWPSQTLARPARRRWRSAAHACRRTTASIMESQRPARQMSRHNAPSKRYCRANQVCCPFTKILCHYLRSCSAGPGTRACRGTQVPGAALQDDQRVLPDTDVARGAHGALGVQEGPGAHWYVSLVASLGLALISLKQSQLQVCATRTWTWCARR